jgi:hypothetical protein
MVVHPGSHSRPVIDWDALQIVENQDEEGRIEIVDDDKMYELIGLRAEDEAAEKAAEAFKRHENGPTSGGNDSYCEDETLGAAIPITDEIP